VMLLLVMPIRGCATLRRDRMAVEPLERPPALHSSS
jgi:hypothetical protein